MASDSSPAPDVSFLRLSFLICKMGIITHHTGAADAMVPTRKEEREAVLSVTPLSSIQICTGAKRVTLPKLLRRARSKLRRSRRGGSGPLLRGTQAFPARRRG